MFKFLKKKNPHQQRIYQAILQSIVLVGTRFEIIDAENYIPSDPFRFSIKLEVFVGIDDGSEGSERFDIFVCTPNWLEHALKLEESVIMGHGLLIVDSYHYEKIRSRIESYIAMCKGDTVDDVFRRVGLLGDWESEWEIKYRP